jgi:multidrug resistance efflux pump
MTDATPAQLRLEQLESLLRDIREGIIEDARATVWVGPGFKAIDAIDIALRDALPERDRIDELQRLVVDLKHDLQLAKQRVQAANAQLAAQAERQAELETLLSERDEREYAQAKAVFEHTRERCAQLVESMDSTAAAVIRRMELDP